MSQIAAVHDLFAVDLENMDQVFAPFRAAAVIVGGQDGRNGKRTGAIGRKNGYRIYPSMVVMTVAAKHLMGA